MNIQQLIDQDARVVEIRKTYQQLIQQKHQIIQVLSHTEADIIKASGSYEAIVKEIVAKYQADTTTDANDSEPEPVDPVDSPVVAEENQDDGFADVEPTPVEPSAENPNPKVEE